MNWKQIKDITLQKIFATQGGSPIQDDAAKDYACAMPAAANEALVMLAARGFSEVKRLEFWSEANEIKSLEEIAPDFLRPASPLQTKNGEVCSGKVLNKAVIIPKQGEYTMLYFCKAQSITGQTPDTEEINIGAQVAAVLPLYIASQLYKDDDASMAVSYRNEYEAAVDILQQGLGEMGEEFEQTAGWCV